MVVNKNIRTKCCDCVMLPNKCEVCPDGPDDTYNIHQHLINRHLNINLYTDVVISNTIVTFELWNLSGKMIGYQQYNPLGDKNKCNDKNKNKYYTYITKINKKCELAVWGLQVLNPTNRTIYLVEGIFKACRFHNYGLNSLAVLGNDPKHLKDWLNSLGYNIVSVCDGDNAGKKLAKYGNTTHYLPDEVYVDDMTEYEFLSLLKQLGQYDLQK